MSALLWGAIVFAVVARVNPANVGPEIAQAGHAVKIYVAGFLPVR